jgi:hypothetical protein
MQNEAPRPISVSKSIVPLCFCTTERAIAKPWPVRFADLLGGKEWFENLVPDFLRNARTGITDANLYSGGNPRGRYGNRAFRAWLFLNHFLDGVRGIKACHELFAKIVCTM